MTTTDHTITPNESNKAARAIDAALASERTPISHYTARIIAAAIHEGDGTALQHFAASGQFDVDTLGHEVTRLALAPAQEPWRRALLDFLLSMRRTHPWARSAVRPPHPRRMNSHQIWFSGSERLDDAE